MASAGSSSDTEDEEGESGDESSEDEEEHKPNKRSTRGGGVSGQRGTRGSGGGASRGRPPRGRPSSGRPSPPAAAAQVTNHTPEVKSNNEDDYVIADLDDPFAVLFDNIVLMADGDGDPICGPFLTLPSKKDYPDYYDDIQQPIALDKIRTKVIKCKFLNLLNSVRVFVSRFSGWKTHFEASDQIDF